MSAQLLLCISQEDAQRPYTFKVTNINVYSLEEALYHCYYYFRQSIDDFSSEEFISWVKNELGQSFLASKIKELSKIKDIDDRLLGFFSISDYFDKTQIDEIKDKISEWGNSLEWEHLKERADYCMENNEPKKALIFYKQALVHEKNPELLNNLAVALMQTYNFNEAVNFLEQAREQASKNFQILLNLIEATIYSHKFEKAFILLKEAEKINRNHPDIFYLFGELNFEVGNFNHAIEYFNKAVFMKQETHYYIRMANTYLKLRKFENAMKVLELVPKDEKLVFIKKAEIFEKQNNIPASIKCIENALTVEPNDVQLWIKLAMYNRNNYDTDSAFNAINKALTISPSNESAKIELARIRKAQGKTKEYQAVLHDILQGLKESYRDE